MVVAYFLVQSYMLLTISKYGNPVDEEARQAIADSVMQSQRSRSDSELKFERRQRAYRDIADR